MKDTHVNQRLFFTLAVLVLSVLFVPHGHASSDISDRDRKRLSEIISEELLFVKEGLDFVVKNKDATWAQGDHEFYDLWLRGIESEMKGKFSDAIAFYEKAIEVERYEMSTFEARFPLGRAYFSSEKCDKALSTLNEFIKNAEYDLSNGGEWGLTPEGERILRRRMAHARWLIGLCK